MAQKKRLGFSYYVSKEQVDKYRHWSLKRRLEWLYWGNLMRKGLPEEIIEIQEKFRRGEAIK